MAISYSIDVDRDLVLTIASGSVTDEDILNHKAGLALDPDFKPGMRELVDARNIDDLDVTPAGVQAMAQQDRDDAARGVLHSIALVISDDAAFGMARMYQTLTDSNRKSVGVFRDLEEAKAWLRLKPE